MPPALPYDPGRLPERDSPAPGEAIVISVSGYPPYKDRRFSCRNPRHRHYQRFASLRAAATKVMAGRAWTHESVELVLDVRGPALEQGRDLIDYLGGVMDALGGSHGYEFTYLPIVFNDDCQVASVTMGAKESFAASYEVRVVFGGSPRSGP